LCGGRTIEIMTIPIHAERASRENRDDKKRYRAKTFEAVSFCLQQV
jgi:hypothetical protein